MLTDLWLDLVGFPRAEPLIEGSRRGTAAEHGARPPRVRQRSLATLSREKSTFPVNKRCYRQYYPKNQQLLTPFIQPKSKEADFFFKRWLKPVFKIPIKTVRQPLMLNWQPRQEMHDCISIKVQH